ncbi:MAG: glycoside hydrolase family 9 protein [Lachnospiraceae bacterium]|nr:glycoside hydrolase family 9 protein [Lachnospiraceae bacterium]
MKKVKLPVILLCLLLFSGCGKVPAATAVEPKVPGEENITSMEEEPVISYEVPESIPGILVNQLGYLPTGTKKAVFQGKEIPHVFHVIKEETGEIVFIGRPDEEVYDKAKDEYISYGDFSQVKAEGTYYIEAPILGRSYSFMIEENIYDDMFREACKQYYYNRCGMTLTEAFAGSAAHNACHIGNAVLVEDISVSMDVTGGWHQDEKGQKSVVAASGAIARMCLSYELYPKAFTDDMGIPESGNEIPDLLDEIKYEVDLLLKMQDAKTGAVYAGISVFTPGLDASGKASDIYVEPASAAAEKAFAMALAKFSYLYQQYDAAFATTCLKAADRAYKHALLHEEEADSMLFAAAAELYRAAGQQSFHQQVTSYLQNNKENLYEDEMDLLGGVTYLSTKHRVRTDLCEEIMERLMSRAEEISLESKEALYLTKGNEAQDNNMELLSDMMYLAVVNYIISNHEYETVIEDHLHYFLGRNAKAISYVENTGERGYEQAAGTLGLMKQFETDSKFIFMLSEVVINGGRK